MKVRSGLLALLPLLGLPTPGRAAGEIPGAVVVVEEYRAWRPGLWPEAAPPRFVLMEDGQVFVGGTSEVLTARLEAPEAKAIEKRVEALRRLPGLGGSMALGPGEGRYKVSLRKGRPLDIAVSGSPEGAPAALAPLASLLADLTAFHDPALRPLAPTAYSMMARKEALPGGCRAATLPVSPADAVFAPRVVPATAVEGWPRGATPASVCAGEDRFTVALRPLLPVER